MQEPEKREQRRRWLWRHWRVVVPITLVVALLLGIVLYDNQEAVRLLFTGANPAIAISGEAHLSLPPGFQANTFVTGLKGPRFIEYGPDDTLFVAERGTGSILALSDPGHTGKAISKRVVVSGLNDPTSVDFYQGSLYVGEADKISRFTLNTNLQVVSRKLLVPLPAGGQHNTRTVLIGTDNKMYVSIGSTCNICVENDPHRAAIWVYNLDGSDGHLYAHGLRNAVGMANNPWNGQIWVTNNGRDYMGDNLPPDTVYSLQAGGNYGWPYCHAGTIIDPNLGHAGDCAGVVQPLIDIQAHSAPLGLAFYTASQFPARYHGLFIALHGSWNRSVPTGYKVIFVPLNSQGQVSGPAQDFLTGWLVKNTTTGRPVGLAVGPDGSLFISDDDTGTIYRITYG